jgi:hypothetical protein
MAASCAASIRYWDPQRPIQLVTDVDELGEFAWLFDVITPYRERVGFEGPASKLRMFEFAVFEETMFVDADCLMMKPDIGHYWSELAVNHDVTTPGRWRTHGNWYGTTIEAMLEQTHTERLVQMNSGVFYFKRNDTAREFFGITNELYMEFGNFTKHNHRGTGAPDEPTFAVAFGRLDIDPFRIVDADGSAWMVSTISGREWNLSATTGEPRFWKGGDISPTLLHFVGLDPEPHYSGLSNYYLGWAAGRTGRSRPLDRWTESLRRLPRPQRI